MAIYAKHLNGKQKQMLKTYEAICGFEPMGQDDLDAGNITFGELWQMNVRFIEDVLAEITNIPHSGTKAYR